MANRRAHAHLTDHNWMLEIEGVTTGAVHLDGAGPRAAASPKLMESISNGTVFKKLEI